MRRVELVSVTGERIPLSEAPFYASPNVALSGMPRVLITSHPTLDAGGQRVTSRRYGTRDLPVRVAILAESQDEFDDAVGRLARAVDPMVGDVTVRFLRDDGTAREVLATYVDGFTNVGLQWAGSRETETSLIFEAFDPYWRAAADVEVDINASAFVGTGEAMAFDAPVDFDAAIPFNGYTETGFQRFLVDLDSEVEAWPRWQITGPVVGLTAVNLTTNRLWSISAAVGTDAQLVLDTSPGSRQVTVNDANQFATLTDDSDLWSLRPGRNWIGIRVQGWDAAHSTMVMSWRDRFLTC